MVQKFDQQQNFGRLSDVAVNLGTALASELCAKHG